MALLCLPQYSPTIITLNRTSTQTICVLTAKPQQRELLYTMKLDGFLMFGVVGFAAFTNCHAVAGGKHDHDVSTITAAPSLDATTAPRILPRKIKTYYTMRDGHVVKSCPKYCENGGASDPQYAIACCCCVPKGQFERGAGWKRDEPTPETILPSTSGMPGVDYLPTQLTDVIALLHGQELAEHCSSRCTADPYGSACFACVPNHKLFTLNVNNGTTPACTETPYGAGCFSQVSDMASFLTPVAEYEAMQESGMEGTSLGSPCLACDEDRQSGDCLTCVAGLHSKVWAI